MKPEQFIREYGVGIAKSVLTGLPKRCTHMTDDARMFINEHNKELDENVRKQLPNLIRLDDLKRLVESLGLIEKVGGIKKAKHMLELFEDRKGRTDNYMPLFRAVQDHESIYGASHE